MFHLLTSDRSQERAGTGLEPRWSQERRDFHGKGRQPAAGHVVFVRTLQIRLFLHIKYHYFGEHMLVHLFKELICFRQYAIYLHRCGSYICSTHRVYIDLKSPQTYRIHHTRGKFWISFGKALAAGHIWKMLWLKRRRNSSSRPGKMLCLGWDYGPWMGREQRRRLCNMRIY